MDPIFMDSHPALTSRPNPLRVRACIQSVMTWLRTFAAACSDYYRAAAKYEDLSRLSDAELRRRSFSRETLAPEICEGVERANVR